MPRTSLRRAEQRHAARGGGPETQTFFDGPEGQAWLHRLVIVLVLVVVLQSGAGVERVQFILRCLRLDTRVACSRSHLQERAREMGAQVRAFGVEQTLALSAQMPRRTVTVTADEMWLAGTMILVANDPVSGWLWVQKIAVSRDQATWTEAVKEGTQGMSLTIRTIGADCGPGLIAMALAGFGVLHSADVFHGQYELTKGYSRRLAARVRAAETLHAAALEAAKQAGCAEPGAPAARPLDHAADGTVPVTRSEPVSHASERALREALADAATMKAVVRGISEQVHPVDLATGTPRSGAAVVQALDAWMTQGRAVAATLGQPKAIEKVQKLVPTWGSMVHTWWVAVATRIATVPLSNGLFALVLTVLIPAMYLDWVRERNHLTVEARAGLTTVRNTLLATVRVHAEWKALPPATRHHLVAIAQDCARWFVRCTGSTEGHNGWLRLRFHQLHAVTPAWLDTQRVLHNFLIRRADGTTAARRFFAADHADLVEYLVAHMPRPALPRRRDTATLSPLKRLNL